MTELRNRIKNLKLAIMCTLSEPYEEGDLNDILKTIDNIFPEEYLDKGGTLDDR